MSKTLHSPVKLPGTECQINSQVPLTNLTTWKVGGKAEWYVAPRNHDELEASVWWALKESIPVMTLGAGSNLLVSDRGIAGLVISTRHLRHYHFEAESGQIIAGAGEPIARLAWQAAKRGWGGFEWAVGIPGTVGGGVVMNAGAHQQCAADSLSSALVLSVDGKLESLTVEQLGYSYRSSLLQNDSRIVLQASFQLQPGCDKEQIMAITNQNLLQRKNSQPYDKPSCGSVFRNPTPKAAGWLIEQIGLKGYQIGGAQVAHRHANFILNCGGATADDIFRLICYVQEQVERHWSVLLEPEVKLIGDFC